MARVGVKHLVSCVCVLPQLSRSTAAPSYQFTVFSVLDDVTDDLEPSFVQCTNCGVVHKVVDVCRSTIVRGRDELRGVVTVDDVKGSLPEKFVVILEQNRVDLATWQQVAWSLENKIWGQNVILSSEFIDGVRQGKMLTILGESLFKVSPFLYETVAS